MSQASTTILVVDDDEPMRLYLKEVLTQEGHNCICFADSVEALVYIVATQGPADLVLSDVGMPGLIDGIDFLRRVRMLVPHLPVLIISGIGDPERVEAALKTGAVGYLHKPVAPKDLSETVSRLLSVAGKT